MCDCCMVMDAHETDCAGDYYGSAVEDECGVCNGSGISDGACDCDGSVLDCNDDCGGSAVEDECGVCEGSGPELGFDCQGNPMDYVNLSFGNATDSSIEILYSSDNSIGGFQFNVESCHPDLVAR